MEATLEVKNIGGIEETSVTLQPDVNIFSGRNATNRTSLLLALNAVLGGDQATVREGADEGTVTLTIGDNTYTRTIPADGKPTGTPYYTESDNTNIDEKALVNNFVTLIETNQIRTAIERGRASSDNDTDTDSELYNALTSVINVDKIEDTIQERKTERENLEEGIEEIEQKRKKAPQLEQKKNTLEEEIEELETEISELEDQLEEISEEEEQTEDEVDNLLSELNTKETTLRSKKRQLENEKDAIESNKSEIETVEQEIEELQKNRQDIDKDELKSRLDELRDEKHKLEADKSEIQQLISANRKAQDADERFRRLLETDSESGADLTEQLVEDTTECWACGHSVKMDELEERTEQLRSIKSGLHDKVRSLEEEIEEIQETLKTFDDRQNTIGSKKERLSYLREDTEERKETIETLESDIETLENSIESLEEDIENAKTEDNSERIELEQKIPNLRQTVGEKKNELSSVEEELDNIGDEKEKLDQKKSQHDELTEEIEELRSRKQEIERGLKEEFNSRMSEVLDLLDYENIETINVDYRPEKGEYHLRITRPGLGETSLKTLSESEREVVGLVVALTGYLVMEGNEEVPFLILDSLEAIDANRIEAVLDYFSEETTYVVAALLEEDADAMSGSDFHRIESAELQTA